MAGSAWEQAVDNEVTPDVSDNAIEDIVEYSRGNVVGNEEQFVLMALQAVSGYHYDMGRYTNFVAEGPPGSGKTHSQKELFGIIPKHIMYGDGEITDFSDNAPLDDPDWNKALLAPLDEYDKISQAIREYMKSMAGDDGGYKKKRNVEDKDAHGGYSPEVVESVSVPFQVLYAPTGRKEGLDPELKDRLLKIPFDSSKPIREAIGRMHAGHADITPKGYDRTYIYDTKQTKRSLRSHLRDLDDTIIHHYHEEEGHLVARRGGLYTHMPDWVWYSTKSVFDIDSTHTNRVYAMLFNLMRGSAIWNHHSNPRVDVDEDEGEDEAIVVTAQDVANVLLCQDTLVGTTHLLNESKRDILDAVRATSGRGDSRGADLTQIRNWLKENDCTVPTKQTLRKRLKDDLAENYYVRVNEGAGDKGADLFEFRSAGKLNTPNVRGLQALADEDDVVLDGTWVDPDDPFDGCRDPIREQPFKQTVEELESELTGTDSTEDNTSAAAYMSGGGSSSDTSTTDGSATFDDFEQDDEDVSVPEETVTRYVFQLIEDTCGTDGEVFKLGGNTPVEDAHLMGVIAEDEPLTNETKSGTIYSPSHPLWSHDHIDDERVTTREEAALNIDDAITRLFEEGLVREDDEFANRDDDDGFLGISVADVGEYEQITV